LGKIDVTQPEQGVQPTDNEKIVFYTAMYHTAIAPCVYSDYNGEYRGMDGKVHVAKGFERYTVFSLWDTYRALHPLFTIIERERTIDFLKTFLSIYNECNKLPIWELWANETDCMIGYHSVSVIADALAKGITPNNYARLSYDEVNQLLNAMIVSSNKAEYGIDFNNKDKLVRGEKEHESVSKTLEYAYDNWCIGVVAKMLGKDTISKEYFKKGQYYKNIFHPTTHFMTPVVNGSFMKDFNPREVNNHFTEANSWQYSFYAPQDINTLIDMHGGDKEFNLKLDSLFSAPTETTGRNQVDITGLIGQYAHGNEPSHHAAYLYNYSGEAWKTQKLVNQILTTLYTHTPDGLCGNDDCGQMSAWYVLSSLGFYPVTPGTDEYIIGSPLYPKAIISMENGSKTTIARTPNKDIYINSIKLNGIPYNKSYIKWSQIINSDLEFTMSNNPNKDFGTEKENRPTSRITDCNNIILNPIFNYTSNVFNDSVIVKIDGANKAFIHSGNKVEEVKDASKPFTIYNNCYVTAYSSDTTSKTTSHFYKIKKT
jgi:alpha-1,2-mannosidase, putative